MKLFLSTLIILLFTSDGICQKNSLIGKWKVSIVNSDNVFYYDVKKDSLCFSKEFKMHFKNSPKSLENVAEMIRSMYQNTIDSYDEDGNYIEFIEKSQYHLKYKVDEVNRIIRILDTDNVTIRSKKMEFNFKNNQLYYISYGVGFFGKTEFILSKI